MKLRLAFLSLVATAAIAQSSWDRVYLEENRSFSREPNAFLVSAVKGLEPGAALDVGMGQGRNAVFLAARGWAVTGFDVSPEGVRQALAAADEKGLDITATVEPAQRFDWGTERWDLIVLAYFPFTRQMLEKVEQSLKPGGRVALEAYHASNERPAGPGVTFEANELLELFRGYRILRYEDTRGTADWGLREMQLVRLLAQKPH